MSPRVFVSFAKRDHEFVQRFIPALKHQALDVWIYEDEEGEIHGGDCNSDRLCTQIDSSTAFLPVVSPYAFASIWTAKEVVYARRRRAAGAALLIVPVVSQHVQDGNTHPWPEAYAPLLELRYRIVDFASQVSLHDLVVGLCKDLGIEYRPYLPQDSRLPYLDRFLQEVRTKCPRRDDREFGIYCRLMEILNRFAEAFEEADYRRARWAMTVFCLMCEYEFPESRFNYPYVVRAVCELLDGDENSAFETFQELVRSGLADESAYCGLGNICFRRNDYAEALVHYHQAKQLYPCDAAATAGEILCGVMTGQPIDLEKAFRIIDGEQITNQEDQAKLTTIKAVALANNHRFDEARELFGQVVDSSADPVRVLHFARALRERGDLPGAVAILSQYGDRFADAVLWHDLALCQVQMGNLCEATRVYRVLIDREPQDRRYRVELARVLWSRGDRRQARQIVAPLLAVHDQSPPKSPEDFYLDGFANWIDDRQERADYDFQRSGFPASQHYKRLLPP